MEHTSKQSLRQRKRKLQPTIKNRRRKTMQPTKPIRMRNPTKQHNRKRFKSYNNGFKSIKTRYKSSYGEIRKMLVQISDKEQSRIEPATQYFKELGLTVEITNLQYGDYVFDNKVAFEYKTIADFIASIQDNRVFNEAINQAENYNWHYVLIQGNEHERTKCLAMTKHYVPVTIFQYYGAIASINRYSTVLEVYSPYIQEAFYKMYIQARKDLSTKPIVKRHGRKSKNTAFNILTNDIYGVNWKKAEAIVKTHNLKTMADLFKLTKDDLTIIEGIGDKTATHIINAIGEL